MEASSKRMGKVAKNCYRCTRNFAIEHSTIQKVKMYVLNKRREPVDESKSLASVSIRVSHNPISFVLLIEA